jgi:hypothetical protein
MCRQSTFGPECQLESTYVFKRFSHTQRTYGNYAPVKRNIGQLQSNWKSQGIASCEVEVLKTVKIDGCRSSAAGRKVETRGFVRQRGALNLQAKSKWRLIIGAASQQGINAHGGLEGTGVAAGVMRARVIMEYIFCPVTS